MAIGRGRLNLVFFSNVVGLLETLLAEKIVGRYVLREEEGGALVEIYPNICPLSLLRAFHIATLLYMLFYSLFRRGLNEIL